jgi:hypothetical protein
MTSIKGNALCINSEKNGYKEFQIGEDVKLVTVEELDLIGKLTYIKDDVIGVQEETCKRVTEIKVFDIADYREV